jgi:hypothetical protein
MLHTPIYDMTVDHHLLLFFLVYFNFEYQV